MPIAQLRDRLAPIIGGDEQEIGVYCGSGVSAAYQIAALAALGRLASLYPGSWSAWSADPERPVQIGTR
ncbi:rhodanese-like domain-containing protein [Rhizobium puerariae]|uniref:Rhodanese-like domain-containing protein n=1 Tax=Rhizobium puerariae TaxID=1585791 RepID=A0ABV6AJI7_9HYPH